MDGYPSCRYIRSPVAKLLGTRGVWRAHSALFWPQRDPRRPSRLLTYLLSNHSTRDLHTRVEASLFRGWPSELLASAGRRDLRRILALRPRGGPRVESPRSAAAGLHLLQRLSTPQRRQLWARTSAPSPTGQGKATCEGEPGTILNPSHGAGAFGEVRREGDGGFRAHGKLGSLGGRPSGSQESLAAGLHVVAWGTQLRATDCA